MSQFCTGEGNGDEFRRFEYDQSVRIVCPVEGDRTTTNIHYIFANLADEEDDFSVAAKYNKVLIQQLHDMKVALLDYTNIILWLNKFYRSNAPLALKRKYLALLTKIMRSKADLDTVMHADENDLPDVPEVGVVDDYADEIVRRENRQAVHQAGIDMEVSRYPLNL